MRGAAWVATGALTAALLVVGACSDDRDAPAGGMGTGGASMAGRGGAAGVGGAGGGGAPQGGAGGALRGVALNGGGKVTVVRVEAAVLAVTA